MPKLSKQDVLLKLRELGVEHDPAASYTYLLTLLKQREETKEESTPVTEEATIEVKEEGVAQEVAKATEELTEARNPFRSFETKTPLTAKAHEMRKKLMHQPRVPVMIPLGHEEKVGATHQVTLNGYPMYIRKGVMVDVPLQVAEVLNEKFKHQDWVRQHPLRASVDNIKLQQFD